MHNIVIKGTKQWETINSFRTDNGETVFEDASTKEDAIAKARELALEKCYHQCCSIKRLVGIDGVIAIAEFIPLECADDTNIYVFWVFQTKVEEQDEDELADAHTETIHTANFQSKKICSVCRTFFNIITMEKEIT
jgi:hypothetical protein